MQRLLVIADDLTGAAEIAGVGLRHGLATRLVRDTLQDAGLGLTVVDTDSRLLGAAEAARAVQQVLQHVKAAAFDLIYKKTDSVLRGQVRAEIEALLPVSGRASALLAPQNPSRGRTIAGGIYRINGVPLDQTAFANDPDHPCRTAKAADLLGVGNSSAITIGDASNCDDLKHLADVATGQLLPAGGADFFQAILESRGLQSSRPFLTKLQGEARLFVCGSASAYSKELFDLARRHRIPVLSMPDEIFSGQVCEVGSWFSAISHVMRQNRRALVNIGRPIDRSPGTGNRLQTALAELVAQVLAQQQIDTLLIDGGATASAVCRRMNWNEFDVEAELAGGVVQMSVRQAGPAPQLVIKPGSYAWPQHVFAIQSE